METQSKNEHDNSRKLRQRLDELFVEIMEGNFDDHEFMALVEFEHRLRLTVHGVKTAERISNEKIPTTSNSADNFKAFDHIKNWLNFDTPIGRIESESEKYFQLREYYLNLATHITPEKLKTILDNVGILVVQRSKFIREFENSPNLDTNSLQEKISLIDFTNQLICKLLTLPHRNILPNK